jgi:small-conductance mechanosensitive channel
LPDEGTIVHINYLRDDVAPTLTDLQVGSVVRTLAESVALEIARLYAQLDAVYDAAFIDTAAGSALDKVVALVVLLQAARWATGAVAFYVGRHVEQRRATADAASVWAARMIGFGANVAVWAIILVAVLDNLGFDVTTLVTGLGIGGIAVALAVQSILGDAFAALAIVLDKPFVVGDFITVDNFAGTVEQIGLKTTRLRSLSGEQIIFANAELLKGRIRNYKRLYERRNVFTLDVTSDTPRDVVGRIPGMLREIVEAQRPIRFDRSHFSAYADSALRFETVYYVLDPDYNRHMDIQQAIFLAVLERFEREGIEFAVPTRMVIYKHGDEAPAEAGSAYGRGRSSSLGAPWRNEPGRWKSKSPGTLRKESWTEGSDLRGLPTSKATGSTPHQPRSTAR